MSFLGDAWGGLTGALGSVTGTENPLNTTVGQNYLGDKGNIDPATGKPRQDLTYGGVADKAGQYLGTLYTQPTATAPEAQQGLVTNAGVTNAGPAVNAGVTNANAASMQAAQLNTAQSDQTRQGQQQLANSLQQTAAGQGPSIAQEQLRQATGQNINQQIAAAQGMHGAARLAALRGAQTAGAGIQQTANSQASALRAQEIASAQGNLGNALGTTRTQDLTGATTAAGLQQQAGATNAGLQQQTALANSGAANTAALTNAGAANTVDLQNANAANTIGLANSQAANTSSNNWATQQNSQNVALAQANLQAGLQTNALNTQRAQSLVSADQNAVNGIAGIDQNALKAQTDYEGVKRGAATGVLNAAGSSMIPGGSLGSSLGGLSI
jgi:hypothetical protein